MIVSILHDMEWVVPLRHEALTPIFKAFTTLGYTEFFFAALPLLYWCWQKDSANRVAILTLLAGMVTLFLKDLYQDPRPPAELAVEGTRPDSFGLPSGHTLMAIVFWGSLAFESQKRWVLLVASIMIIGITTSRLYLAVHDIEDVLAGILIGGALLAALIIKRRRYPDCCRADRWWWLSLTPAAALLLLFPQDGNVGKMILVATFFTAWLIGSRIEKRYLAFSSPSGWKRLVIGVCGILLLSFIAFLLHTVLKQGQLPGIMNAAIGGLLMGIAVTLLTPSILVKLKLLQRSKS